MPTIGNVTIVGGFRRSVKKRKQQKNQKMRFSYVRSQNKACLRILQPFIIGLLATLLPTFLIACVLWDILLIFIWLTTSNGKSRCFIFTNSLAINRKHPLSSSVDPFMAAVRCGIICDAIMDRSRHAWPLITLYPFACFQHLSPPFSSAAELHQRSSSTEYIRWAAAVVLVPMSKTSL